jgi:hypothetical protein
MNTVKSADSLQTSISDTVKGFIWQAQEKLPKAELFIKNAAFFEKEIPKITNWDYVFSNTKLQEFAIAASCLSKKSLNHINAAQQRKIIESLIDIKKLKDSSYFEIIKARYFLTCGDSLGGTMRNLVGQSAQTKLTDLIIQSLKNKNVSFVAQKNSSEKITSITWSNRFLCFDKKPKFVGKSIDFILIKGTDDIENISGYLACGELKGGIDPAGADEHWKTARTALDRISDVFLSKKMAPPKLFFIGAAIEASMSLEIFERLNNHKLRAAANLNNDLQLKELVDILISL